MREIWHRTAVAAFSIVSVWCAVGVNAQESGKALPAVSLHAASSLTELPVGPWGPYSRAHCGPCFLASRLQGQMFAFPIVVGQSRVIIQNLQGKDSTNSAGILSSRVALHRRSSGLSPLQTGDIDSPASLLPHSVVEEADASGILWKYKIEFPEAPILKGDSPPVDSAGNALPPHKWGKGTAEIEYMPANVEPSSDGLLLQVTITNQADKPQTYYVDFLGGMNSFSPAFELNELRVNLPKDGSTVVIKHDRCPVAFSLFANSTPYAAHYYRVDDRYFTSLGGMEQLGNSGRSVPAASVDFQSTIKAISQTKNEVTDETQRGSWGLLRVDDILLDPGQSATINMSVGIGRDAESAQENAQVLLGSAEDISPFGKSLRVGLFTKAAELHAAARLHSGDGAIDQLMAQSLVNIPYALGRRIAVPTRVSTRKRTGGIYQPEGGGMTALAWSSYRPDWAAAQLNAWFLTQGDPDAVNPHPRIELPINLFALWDLWQQTNDQDLLAKFYPFAVKRYRELIRAASISQMPNLYGWLQGVPAFSSHSDMLDTTLDAQPTVPDPALTACIARSAIILASMASQLSRPAEEKLGFINQRDLMIKELESKLWSDSRSEYFPQQTKSDLPNTIAGLVPLVVSGYLSDTAHRSTLLNTLKSESRFWSSEGVQTLDASSVGPDSKKLRSLPLEIDYNWMIWKSLLDMGESDTARQLSENLLKTFHNAIEMRGGFPAFIGQNGGIADAALDYSGDNCALIVLNSAYHNFGQVTCGWDTMILGHQYLPAQDSCHIITRNIRPEGSGVILCVMGKPKTKYLVSGALAGEYVSDQTGVITLILPKDSTTLTIDIKKFDPPAEPQS